jgi:hypothetical protein
MSIIVNCRRDRANARYKARPKAVGWMPEFDRFVDSQRRPSNSSTVSPMSRAIFRSSVGEISRLP